MKNPYQQSINEYKSMELKSKIETSSPHELINLLLHGVRTHIATAQGNMQRNEISQKGEHISKAIEIIEGLKTSLNPELGGEVARNLLQLYEYVQYLLLTANVQNNQDLLAESNKLIAEVHEAWQQITPASQSS